MKKTAAILLAFLVSVGAAASEPLRPPRVLMISIDGLRPIDFLNASDHGPALPNLTALVENGVYADGVTGVLPTVTYPSHVTLITGVTPAVHGIESNHVLDVEDRGQDPWYWFAEDIRVPTLVDAAEMQGLVTGSVSWPGSIGLPADYLLPEFWRGWSRHPFDRRILEHLSTPGLMESVGRARGKVVPGFTDMTDRDRTDIAKWIITTAVPDLLLVHLFDLDFAEHDFGPGSPQAFSALEASDAMVGEMIDALKTVEALESTVIFIVSDHGFFPLHTSVAPNTLLVEAGLIRLDDDGRVEGWDAYFLCDGGSAALVLKDPTRTEILEKVESLVREKAAQDGSGIFRVLTKQEAAQMGSNAPLVLDAASGYELTRRLSGGWSSQTRRRGVHGHAPERLEAQTSLIISGARIRSRGPIGIQPMTRIAPTVASIIGVRLGEEADKPIPLEVEATPQR